MDKPDRQRVSVFLDPRVAALFRQTAKRRDKRTVQGQLEVLIQDYLDRRGIPCERTEPISAAG